MWYDVFVIAILIVAMVRGAIRGVVWQLAGIAGIVLCLVFAETISAVGAPFVSLEPPLNHWVVMFVAYLFFSFLSFGFARLINGALEKAELKEYNKHLGAIFGVVKGAVFCLVITFFLVTLSATTREWLQSSRSARYAAIIMDRLHPVMPEKLRGALVRYIHDLDADDLDLPHINHDSLPHDPELLPWDPLADSATPKGDAQSPSASGSPFDILPPALPQSPTLPTTADAVDALLRQIPALANDSWTRDGVVEVYQTIPESNRAAFLQELKNAGPALLLAVLQKWRSQPSPPTNPPSVKPPASCGPDWSSFDDSSSSGSTQNVSHTQPPVVDRAALVAEIVGRLARTPQDQPAYEQSINRGLQGLPDSIGRGVLEDWHADLVAGSADPDPQTNAGTSLDQRIIRQLTLQQVSVFQLSQELQTRLMQARSQ